MQIEKRRKWIDYWGYGMIILSVGIILFFILGIVKLFYAPIDKPPTSPISEEELRLVFEKARKTRIIWTTLLISLFAFLAVIGKGLINRRLWALRALQIISFPLIGILILLSGFYISAIDSWDAIDLRLVVAASISLLLLFALSIVNMQFRKRAVRDEFT